MIALDAVPRTVMVNLETNSCGPLAPFSADAERARVRGLASIGNLIKRHPAVSPKTVTLAVALLDRFLLKTCGHPGLEASTPFAQEGEHTAALATDMGSTYRLHSPALRQAIPLACFVLETRRDMVACPSSRRRPRLCVHCPLPVLVQGCARSRTPRPLRPRLEY